MRGQIARRYITALVTAVTLAGCASLTVKQKASATHQSYHAILTKLDDAEREACQPNPAAVNTCTNPLKIVTDAQHQQVSAMFVKAYALDVKVSKAIIAWQPGMPPPADLQGLKDVTSNLLGVIRAFGTSDKVSQMLAYAQQALDTVSQLVDAFGGKVALEYALLHVTAGDLDYMSGAIDLPNTYFAYTDIEAALVAVNAAAHKDDVHVYVARDLQWIPLAQAQGVR